MWADLTFPPINLYSAPVMLTYRERMNRAASQSKPVRRLAPINGESARRHADLNRLLDMPR